MHSRKVVLWDSRFPYRSCELQTYDETAARRKGILAGCSYRRRIIFLAIDVLPATSR